MPRTDPIVIPFEGESSDLIREANKIQIQMDRLDTLSKKTGLSQSALSQAMRKQGEVVKTTSMSWTDFHSMYSTVLDAVRVGQQVWDATGGEFVDLAEQVKNTSRSLGASAEEASRLIQVADDVRISQQSLKVAFKTAQKDGIEPNIEGLARLSDQYLALPPGVKRTQFAIEVFGSKAGPEMEKLLVKGGSAIKNYAAEIDDSLIITEDAIKASDDYQASLDQLNDAFYGIKVSLGKSFMPAMIAAESVILADIKAVQSFDDVLSGSKSIDDWSAGIINAMPAFTLFGVTIGKVRDDVPDATDAIEDNTDAIDGQKEAVEAAKDALKDYEEQLDAVSQANEDLESMSRTIAKDQRKYEDDHKDAVDEVAELEDELAEAREKYSAEFISNAQKAGFAQKDLNDAIKKYGANSEEAFNAREKLNNIKEAQTESFEGLDETFAKFEEAQGAVTDLEVVWHEAANNMIYDMVLVGVSVGGLLDSEQKALDEYAVKAGIKTQADIDEANRRRDIADSTIAGILQSEDVLTEQRKIDAETLRLTEAQTSAESLAAAGEQVAAINGVSASINSATQSYMAMAAAAMKAAAAAKSIPGAGSGGADSVMHSRDTGGAGIAGQAYMIGVPEVFVAPTNGTFIPLGGASAKDIGSKGDTVFNIQITNAKPESSENSIRRALKLATYTGNFA